MSTSLTEGRERMKFLFAILAVMLIALNAVAAPAKSKPTTTGENVTSTKSLATLSDTWKKLKESPFKLSFSQYHYIQPDNSGQPLRSDFILNDAFLGYNINRQNDVRFMTRGTTFVSERSQAEHQWRWVELRYRRNRILTEDTNFVNFSAEVRFDYIPDEKRRNSTVTNGFVRPQINFSKNWTKSFSTDVSIFSLINDRRSGKNVPGQRIVHSDRYIFSPNYMVNDKITLSCGLTYIHDVYIDTPQNRDPATQFVTSDYLWVDPAINYVFTDWFNLDFDFGGTTNTSHDGRKYWIKNIQTQYWAGVSLNFQIF